MSDINKARIARKKMRKKIKRKKRNKIFRRIFSVLFLMSFIVGIGYGIYYLIPEKIQIVIDPGHGGKDSGAISYSGQYYEKDMNLRFAKMLSRELKKKGFKVSMTREDDTFIELKNRAKFSNEKEADFFISIHHNAAENTMYSGYLSLYAQKYQDAKNKERQNQILSRIHEAIISDIDLKDLGLKEDNELIVLRETNAPAIMLELGFITNEKEEKKIIDSGYQRKVIDKVSQSLKDYFDEEKDAQQKALKEKEAQEKALKEKSQ